jgi:phage head maturation protease
MTETREARASWLHARFAPSSFDAEQRTVEVVWSTGADVRRRDWDGEYTEQLSMEADAVDLSRLEAGAPVLNSHDAYSLSSVLGVVERAWLEKGQGHALLRFSERAEVQPILADIRAGILRNISVGYDVQKWEEGKDKAGKRTKRAVRWQPAEISLVPIPADASAQVRAADAPADMAGVGETEQPKEGRMADNAPQVPEAPAPVINRDEVANEARGAERARVAELRSFVTVAQRQRILPPERLEAIEQEAIASGLDAAGLRARVMDEVLAQPQATAPAPRPVQMGASGDDPLAIRSAMADAMAVGAAPGVKPKTERFREFIGMKISDMLIELAAVRGERVNSRDRRAFMERSMHTSSDFPLLLQDAGNKMLEAGYAILQPTYRQIMAAKSFNDFKPHKFLRLGDYPALAPLGEGGEITAGTISEKREQVTAGTLARSVTLSRQMLVNDELGAFTEFSSMIGQRIATQENALAYDVINTASGAGPTLAEGNAAVFTTGRGNRAASGTTIDVANLALARAAIMKQTSLDGLPIAIGARMMLLVGPDRELLARQLTATFVANATGSINPYVGFIDVVVDPQIPGNRWYMFADATRPFVYGFVAGQTAPQVRVWNPIPGRDGMTVEVIHDFGVGAVDFRGAYFNPGN